jgi:tRNA G37 N-methylase Trm5
MRPSRRFSHLKVAVGFTLLCHPVIGRIIYKLFDGAVPSAGHYFRLDTDGHVSYQQVANVFWGFYEKSERRLISKYLKPDLDVIELGSGVGVISCFILNRQMPDKSLVCVEGNASAIPTLRGNIERNYPQ